MPPKPTSPASPADTQREKRRNRFFEAISTSSTLKTEQSQSTPPRVTKSKSSKKSKETFSKEMAFKLSREAGEMFEKAVTAGAAGSQRTEEVTEQFISLLRSEIIVEPNALMKGGYMNEVDFLKAMKACVYMTQEARSHGATKEMKMAMEFGHIIDKPRESLPPLLQKAQDALVGVEKLRAKTDMPLSNDPKVSKRYMNNMLCINGEAPFPFDQLTERRDPTSALARIIEYDLPARGYKLELRARKPELCDVLADMLSVFEGRAIAVGEEIKKAH